MPLIIDAYNVLHENMPPPLAGLDTAGLCAALARTAWAKQHITVVCDGQPGPLGLLESPEPAVELIYSGPHQTADAVIIRLIDQHTAPRRLIVVSSDREIRRAARRRRATAWTSPEFLHRLAKALKGPGRQPPDISPQTPLPDAEVQKWLEQFNLDPENHDPPPPRRHRPGPRRRPPGHQPDPPPSDDDDDESRYWPPW